MNNISFQGISYLSFHTKKYFMNYFILFNFYLFSVLHHICSTHLRHILVLKSTFNFLIFFLIFNFAKIHINERHNIFILFAMSNFFVIILVKFCKTLSPDIYFANQNWILILRMNVRILLFYMCVTKNAWYFSFLALTLHTLSYFAPHLTSADYQLIQLILRHGSNKLDTSQETGTDCRGVLWTWSGRHCSSITHRK